MRTPEIRPLKDSPVYWIKKIPANWETKPVKRVMSLVANPVGNDWDRTELLSLTQNGVIPRDMESGKGKFPADFSTYQLVDNNQLVMCLFDIDETPRTVGLARQPGMVTGAYSVFSFSGNNNPRYFYYFFLWLDIQKALKPFYTGLRKVVRPGTFASLQIPHPPVEEQSQISNFLDRETAKIDALIAEQQRLIELLQQKRHAVISHAVTKGLNPNAPMKDSGVEWLGEVPEHWEVKKLRFVCKIQTGSRDTEEALDDGEYPFFVRSQTIERINSYSYDCEAVLTAGDGAGVGKVFHYYSGPFDFHQRVYMLNKFKHVHGKLIYHFLKTNFFNVALQGGAKSTVDSLRRPMFTAFPVCIPPEKEQQPLLEFVEAEENRISKLVSSSEEVILLLQERRSALISAAVTGQIDVRALAAEEEP